jgi:hypothetical protein
LGQFESNWGKFSAVGGCREIFGRTWKLLVLLGFVGINGDDFVARIVVIFVARIVMLFVAL